MERFLAPAELPTVARDVCMEVIRRGQRLTQFCRRLGEEKQFAFGSLFFPSIPDSIWDDGGLCGQDYKQVIQHLREKNITELSERKNANCVAQALLEFHADFVCAPEPESHISKKAKGRNRHPKGTKRQHQDSSSNADAHHQEYSESDVDPSIKSQRMAINYPPYLAGTDRSLQEQTLEAGSQEDIGDGELHAPPSSYPPYSSTLDDPPAGAETFARPFEPELDITHLDFFNPDLDMAYLDFSGPIGDTTDPRCF
ncbi:hypothetical protein N7478_001339 [Penicillium angulare]|uniref:uncharacterized protein n=1 Tax=Penicillium angulare TaxID=116970 RepID=UPI00253FF222|nr:uncharacterized protein N7478_001339 [Penicillium angulare]KAJ5292088.1 hypothetical protein N7478_001339 [Penicillium angulare]